MADLATRRTDRRDAARADDGRRARATSRARARAARRARDGRGDARADPDRRGVAHRPLPRRAHAQAGRVLQQAAGRGDGAGLPDPRPDARHRRLGGGHGRHPQGVGRRPHQAGVTDRGARRASPPSQAAHPDVDIHVAALDRTSTSAGTSCRASAMPGDRQFGTFAGPSSEPGHGPSDETAEVVRRLQRDLGE